MFCHLVIKSAPGDVHRLGSTRNIPVVLRQKGAQLLSLNLIDASFGQIVVNRYSGHLNVDVWKLLLSNHRICDELGVSANPFQIQGRKQASRNRTIQVEDPVKRTLDFERYTGK